MLPLVSMWTTTFAELPVQPERIESGSIASEYVKVMVSLCSALPAFPPWSAVCTSEAVGTVLSTVTEKPPCVALFPAPSVAVIEKLLLPAESGLSAVKELLR